MGKNKKFATRIDIIFLGELFSIQKVEEISNWLYDGFYLDSYSLTVEDERSQVWENRLRWPVDNIPTPRILFKLTLKSNFSKDELFYTFKREPLNKLIREIEAYTGSKMIENTVEGFGDSLGLHKVVQTAGGPQAFL